MAKKNPDNSQDPKAQAALTRAKKAQLINHLVGKQGVNAVDAAKAVKNVK